MFSDLTNFKNSNVKNSNFQFLSNEKNFIELNDHFYIFKRYSKSRFFNKKDEEEVQLNKDTNNKENNKLTKNINLNNKINLDNEFLKLKKQKNEKTQTERKGDWTCFFCQNFNFAFRYNCNRCQRTKNETVIMLNKLYFLNLEYTNKIGNKF